ncbi:MAG TPA: hypothetical protein VF297_26715 [Pyrinomonadaceae bacterium]
MVAALDELVVSLAAYNDSADVQATAVYKLSAQSLSTLKTAGVPEDVLTKLGTLQDQKFVGLEQFDAALGAAVSAEEVAQYGAQVVDAARQTSYVLKQTPGPRFYQPTDPVVLMTGAAVEPTLRHGQDSASGEGTLACQLFVTDAAPEMFLPSSAAPLVERVDRIETETAGAGFGFNVWTGQPWNPFLLEWEAEVFPVESGGNLEPDSGRYAPEFISSNFTLIENDVDLTVRSGRGFVTKAANLYSGSCVLSPHASVQLQGQIETYLQDQLLDDYYGARNVPAEERTDDYFAEHTDAILDWYKQANCTPAPAGALCNIIAAYERLNDPSFYCLSQALAGFNEALLMRKQTLQLDIADPLAFDDYRQFTKDVSAAVGDSLTVAPEPFNDFNPIRTGALKLLRLRIVDNFGQSRDVACEQLITTEKLKVANSPYPITLPPRYAQPVRLDFRWLSAASDEQEMNDHPATTPVCGWVLPNNLDDSLMIYDNEGRALGSVDESARWQLAPGAADPVAVEEIQNPHLRQLVSYLLARGETFLRDFISALDNALENIEPENFAQHQGMALLMGRPIALARASLNLELQGRPAVHQGWNAFRQDMRRNARETNGFERVSFPVRIGEYRQFNDGVVGYWREAGGVYEDDIFYAPQSDHIEDEHIRTHADDPMTVYQSADSPPQLLALLFDDDEKPSPQVITLGQLQNTPSTQARFPQFTLEPGQHADDQMTVIDIKQTLLATLLPSVNELALLAHVRQRKDANGDAEGDELAVIIGNRLPPKGAAATVHLVSLERRYQDAAFDYQGAQTQDLIRLVSLRSWRFTCLADHPSFKDLLVNLDRSPSAPRLPSNEPEAAKRYLAAGCVPLPHFMREGDTTVSWYRGPLAPGADDSQSPSLPARAADELARYDPSIGLFDVSYAAAWELGRLLALQSKQLSVSLYNWKRQHARQQLQAEQQLLYPHLPPQGGTTTTTDMPSDITAWFDDLSLLRGVPFNYLVPDERLLPAESIRFFQLDRFWLDCLLDGAFSIGRVTTADQQQDEGHVDSPAANAYELVSGIIMRSSVVAGWPSLLVDAYDEADPAKGAQLKQLRMERLSEGILLCLFAGEMGRVEIHQQPEALHFGLDAPDEQHADYYKDMRDPNGEKGAATVSPVPWRQPPEQRVLDIDALARSFQAMTKDTAFTSALFALQMIEGVDKVIFRASAASNV